MSRHLTIEALVPRFPDFRVYALVVTDFVMPATRSAAMVDFIAARETDCRARWAGTELSQIPGVAAWRGAYRAFGIKKTSYRSSVERLIKRVLAGDNLPAINPLVDLYNAVSLDSGLCLGADDLGKVRGDLAFRFSRPGDTFLDMAAAEGEDPNDPPKEGEVVYADADHVLCRRWNWRQDARSIVTSESRRVVITVQANGYGDPAAAADILKHWIEREFAAEVAVAEARAGAPVAVLPA